MSVNATRCLTSAAWLTSARFKSFYAQTVPPSPRMARQRTNGLSVIVFIIVALTLLGFSIVRYRIIKIFPSPLLLARSSEVLAGVCVSANRLLGCLFLNPDIRLRCCFERFVPRTKARLHHSRGVSAQLPIGILWNV